MPTPTSSNSSSPDPAERLLALLDHLRIARAHLATQMPGDVGELARRHGERLAGVTFCVPTRLDPASFASVSARLELIAGASGLSEVTTARALPRLPGATRTILAGYDAPGWADVVADRRGDVVAALRNHCRRVAADGIAATALDLPPMRGTHGGISFDLSGRGPALLLLPFFLAPSQWQPALDELRQDFTVIVLGGAHLGGIAALEDRALSPSYRLMFDNLVELLAIRPDQRILDVGCGSGVLDRRLAERLGPAASIVASDLNPFLLREAQALAAEAGLAGRIEFTPANAEALPFPDRSFDAAFSVTVFEECDADKALRELYRVLRPGARAGIVVRSIDLRQHWNMQVPPELRERAETPPQSVGTTGVADASLYRRLRQAGFAEVTAFPALITFDRPGSTIWRYREDHVLSQLTPGETVQWMAAREAALAAGTLFTSHAMHCAVGIKAP